MTGAPDDIPALLGSRICHDLISPLGAISNGIELLAMSGAVPGPELSLISESVENANARIRFFRVAFGVSLPGQALAAKEVRAILADFNRVGRLSVDWRPDAAADRGEVKLAFLLLQCAERAMPRGGKIVVDCIDGDWSLRGESDRPLADPELWTGLGDPDGRAAPSAAEVQFLLAPAAAREAGRTLSVDHGARTLSASF